MKTKNETAQIIPEFFREFLVTDPELNKTLSLEIRVSIAGTVISVLTIPSPDYPKALFLPDLLTALKNGDPSRLLAFLLNKGWHASPGEQISKLLS